MSKQEISNGLTRRDFVAAFLAMTGATVSLRASSLDALPKGAGYLLLDTDIGFPDVSFVLDDNRRFERLPEGKNQRLITLPAGEYQWQEVRVPYFDFAHVLSVSDDDRWGFRVSEGHVNYAGSIVVGQRRTRRSVDVSVLNRCAQVRTAAVRRWARELESAPLVWSGLYPDPFFERAMRGESS